VTFPIPEFLTMNPESTKSSSMASVVKVGQVSAKPDVPPQPYKNARV